jgi:allophanate hydrolase subunit 1
MVESLCILGITQIRVLKDGVHIAYDARIVDAADLEDMLAAADSAVRFMWGNSPGRTHTLHVMLGGPSGPDLSVASILLDTTEKALVRRLCRTAHAVLSLTAPAASPLLEVFTCRALPPVTQASPRMAFIPPGTLTLSGSGITITTHACHSTELVIGRISSAARLRAGDLNMGDTVHLRPVISDP